MLRPPPAITAAFAAAALSSPAAAGAVPDPMLRLCAGVDSLPGAHCEPPVDCAALGENDCMIWNYEIGPGERRYR